MKQWEFFRLRHFSHGRAKLRLILEIFLNFGLGVFCQRVGDRFNNERLGIAGRSKISDFFYAFHRPIHLSDMIETLKVKELRSFLRLRGLKVSGRKKEPVARTWCAIEQGIVSING